MDWKDLGSKIVSLGAPLLGGAVGGPGGAILGKVVANMFGGDPEDPSDLLSKLTMDSDAALKCKEIESSERIAIAQINQANTDSARDREVEITKATGGLNWPMYVLAGVVVVGFFAVVGILFFVDIPEGSKEVAFMLLGVLGAQFGAVCNYFFGSSKSSADKTQMLGK
jgi:hypothetical protein